MLLMDVQNKIFDSERGKRLSAVHQKNRVKRL